MNDLQNIAVFTAGYATKENAIYDYDAVKELYFETGVMETFDAAVIQKKENGKVSVVKKHEQPTEDAGWVGAGIGVASAFVTALFPAVALTGSLVASGAGIGGAYGAFIGHLADGMNNGDLKELGDSLNYGEYGLIVVAVTDLSKEVEKVITRADKISKKELRADEQKIQQGINEALAA